MGEVNISGKIRDNLHGLIDTIVPGSDKDMTVGSSDWKKAAGISAIKNLQSLGLGKYDRVLEAFVMKGDALEKMMSTMNISELAALNKKLSMKNTQKIT